MASDLPDHPTNPTRGGLTLEDFRAVYRTAKQVLTDVNELGKERWPRWGWLANDRIVQGILDQFRLHARFTVETEAWPVYLVLGYVDPHQTAEIHIAISVESDPEMALAGQGLSAAAGSSPLEPPWVAQRNNWQALSRVEPAASIRGIGANVRWFVNRLSELEVAGVYPQENR